MSDFDREAHLKKLHEERKKKTTDKINKVIDKMLKEGKKINFNSVKNAAGVSKPTVYNKPEIRERIEFLRNQQSKISNPKDLKRKMDNDNKDATIALLKRKIKRLEKENKKLKERLKKDLGEVYKNI